MKDELWPDFYKLRFQERYGRRTLTSQISIIVQWSSEGESIEGIHCGNMAILQYFLKDFYKIPIPSFCGMG